MTVDAWSWTGPQGPGRGHRIGKLPDAALFDIQCGLAHTGWSRLFEVNAFHLVLVRSGGFLHRRNGAEAFTNAASALFMCPGDEMQMAHPLHYPDRFLAVQFTDPPDTGLRAGAIRVGDNVDLLQRIVTAACATDTDGFELAANVLNVVCMLSTSDARSLCSIGSPATAAGHRRMVHATIEALLDDGFRLGLAELARLVGASPHHLSRVFHRITGTPLRVYRNQLRVRSVLARLQEGAGSLADLAVEHGFADHSHLDRVVRRHLGRRPSALRALLAPDADCSDSAGRNQPATTR
jgi:AraC-like DNA-binding protein